MKKKLDWKEIGIEKLVIILLCGVFILVLSWPTGSSGKKKAEKEDEVKETTVEADREEYARTLERRLKSMLSKMEGIERAEVMITLKSSGEKVTLKDRPYTQENSAQKDKDGESTSTQITGDESTVLIETEEGTEPYVLKETEPRVEGVLVLVTGLSDAAVKKEISEAVEALFGVPSHKIKVMKMNVES